MNISDVKTIDVIGKEWYDRVYGNSYCSVKIILNYSLPDQVEIFLPMENGYGDFYTQKASKWLCKHFSIEFIPLWMFRDKGIVERHTLETGCRKRDVQSFGEGK